MSYKITVLAFLAVACVIGKLLFQHGKLWFPFIFCLIVVVTVSAGDDEYYWLRECDNRCEMRNRSKHKTCEIPWITNVSNLLSVLFVTPVNPFQASCDDCCRGRGFSKGKCKGFGWYEIWNNIKTIINLIKHGADFLKWLFQCRQYCMCKQSRGARILNAILNG